MSSTVTQSQLQSVPKEEVTELTRNDFEQKPCVAKQRPQLIRSSSVDKLIKFNAYICSQNYYILPSLLMWLKTSQNVLANTTEKSLSFFKSAIVAAALYKLLEERFKVVFPLGASGWLQAYGSCARSVRDFCLKTVPFAVCASFVYLRQRSAVLAIYASLAIIGLQFLSCLLILCSVFVPAGFLFMLGCMYVMGHIGVAAMFHHMKTEARRQKELSKNGSFSTDSCDLSNAKARPIRSKPHVLGDRTISNVNLF